MSMLAYPLIIPCPLIPDIWTPSNSSQIVSPAFRELVHCGKSVKLRGVTVHKNLGSVRTSVLRSRFGSFSVQ